jgi:beta-galactosidase
MCCNAESLASIARHNRRSYYLGADYFSQREEQVITVMQEASPILASSWHTAETNPRGETLAFTNYYLTRNGQPSLPIMGEFHYSRFPHRYWEEELRKIRAGGVSIVATYLFWNHIEEEENSFDWSGDRNIRAFVEICGSLGLEVVLRCGPFVHGESRNGGLPDWLYSRGIVVRSTNEIYLYYVGRFFAEIGRQVRGLLFKDGGPVIGMQIENEYMHAGAPWEVGHAQSQEFVPPGAEGSSHLLELKQLAQDAGLLVPIYSCTAWGGAPVPEEGFLPTQAGYAFTPWILDPEYEQPPTTEFLFCDRRAQPRAEGKIAYDTARYPYVYSELGSGIQMTYLHRPVVPPECVQAQAIVALGSGTNWLGYYMYHGGSNPTARRFYLNENTVPRISYDFQAPLREYGQVNESYHRLRLLHLFLQEWGAALAPMMPALPANHEQLAPNDTRTLRWAVRSQNNSGFLFLNNYQDHVEMQNHEDIRLCLNGAGESLLIPERRGLHVPKNASAILPFNLFLPHGILLKYATAQFVTQLSRPHQTTCVFFAPEGMEAEFALDPATYRELAVTAGTHTRAHDRDYFTVQPGLTCRVALTALDGALVQILVLTQAQALALWKISLWGEERLLLADGLALQRAEHLDLYWQETQELRLALYPDLPAEFVSSADLRADSPQGVFSCYTLTVPQVVVPLEVQPIDAGTTRIRIPTAPLRDLHDAFFRIDYLGDIGSLYLNGQLISDNFASELPWEIGLKRFLTPGEDLELILRISPLARNDPKRRYLQKKIAACAAPDAAEWLEIFSIGIIPEYHALLARRE